jgi:uncharacterized repeat protein (TIGR02543 family)
MRVAGLLVVLPLLVLVSACSDSDTPDPTTPVQNDPVYHVSYLGNGADSGDAPVDAIEYEEGDLVTVAGSGTLARTGYTFTSWNTAAAGTGLSFAEAATFTIGAADATLYAQWQEEIVVPDGWNPELGTWAYLGATAGLGLSGSAVDYCRIAVNSTGDPVAAFSVATPGALEAKHQARAWNGSSFDDLGGSDFTVDNVSRWFDVVFDGTDDLWISTTDLDNNAHIYSYDGTDWLGATQLTTDEYSFQTSLTTDSLGNPVVAFRFEPETDTDAIGVLKRSGTNWLPYADPYFAKSLNNNTAIAMINDDPYVLFANSMQLAEMVRNVGDTTWEYVGGSPIFHSNSNKSLALTQDSLGRPWIVFRYNGDVRVQYFDGSDWVFVDTATLDNSMDTSSTPQTMDIIMIDDVPVITFVSRIAPRGIRIMAWIAETAEWVDLADSTSIGTYGSSYPQLAAGPDGKIYLGYMDAGASGMMSVKVYTPADDS